MSDWQYEARLVGGRWDGGLVRVGWPVRNGDCIDCFGGWSYQFSAELDIWLFLRRTPRGNRLLDRRVRPRG